MKSKTMLILICGGSGSGKSTVSDLILKTLQKEHNAEIICQDSYYEDVDNDNIENFNYDHPTAFDFNLLKTHIKNILNGEETWIPKYDYKIRKKDMNYKKIQAPKFLILEGLYSLYDPEINNLASFKLFVETPKDECLIRRIKRDVKERGRTLDSILSQWRETVRPMYDEFIEPLKSKADLIIPWTNKNENALEMIQKAILNAGK